MKRKVEYRYNESGKLAEVLTSEEINGMMQVKAFKNSSTNYSFIDQLASLV